MPKIQQKLRDSGYEAVIGLEVHIQLNTETKIFSSDGNGLSEEPNTDVSVISLGHPGTLPVLNKKAVEKAVLMGLACGSEISKTCHFDRKSYFYPDLPKGYQTTQDKKPICIGGSLELFGENFLQEHVQIHHIHLEEDAGKSVHVEGGASLVDLNRAGAPLIELVTEPCIKGAEEAAAFLQEVRRTVRYLGISEANMEKGQLRCDTNISIKPKESEKLGAKVEIKNMNSFAFVKKAIGYELERQLDLLQRNESIAVETRTFDPGSGKTFGMRFKETMNDYRYFPCPDLPPLSISEEFLSALRTKVVTPKQYRRQFKENYQLNEADIQLLTEEKETAEYFSALCDNVKSFKTAANWLNGPLRAFLNEKGMNLSELMIEPKRMAGIVELLESKAVNLNTAARSILPKLVDSELTALEIAKAENLLTVSDERALEDIVKQVLLSLPKEVEAFKKGKKQLMGLFMGQLMKASGGKADAKTVQRILNEELQK